jgi:hypothetical protein
MACAVGVAWVVDALEAVGAASAVGAAAAIATKASASEIRAPVRVLDPIDFAA